MPFMQSNSVGKATKALKKGYDDVINQAKLTKDEQIGVYKPYQEFGAESLNRLRDFETQVQSGDYSQVTSSPEYQFDLSQGINARDRTSAQRGGLYGGAHMKDIQEFGSGLASRQFQNVRNRLLGNIDVGSTGLTGVSNAMGNYLDYYAKAREAKAKGVAQGKIAKGNVWASAFADVAKAIGGGG